MRLALGNALHLWRMEGIDLGSALPLILRQHAPGEAQRLGEDLFELGITVDALPDVADDAAQIGLELAQASVGTLELMGMGVALMLDQRELPDPRIGLAQLDTDLRGKPDQAERPTPSYGVTVAAWQTLQSVENSTAGL